LLTHDLTQRIASSTLDFPQPFGPTIEVIGSGKLMLVLSTNDLNPQMSIRLIFKLASALGQGAGARGHT
jgi:hypothetical protein